jgi:hypothetical protein
MKLAKQKHKHIRIKNPVFWQILSREQQLAKQRRLFEEIMRLDIFITTLKRQNKGKDHG